MLRWLALVLPILFLAGVDVLRQTVFSDQPYAFPGVFGFLLTYAVITLAIVLFSHLVFVFILRLQAGVMARNRQRRPGHDNRLVLMWTRQSNRFASNLSLKHKQNLDRRRRHPVGYFV